VGFALAVLPLAPCAGGPSDAAEVRLPSLAIGKSYSTWRMSEPPLVLRNPTDDTIRVHVEILVPARHELRAGALPVPDRTWVELEAADLVLAPRAVARTDVRLSLPYEPEIAGHLYQVDLWTSVVELHSRRRPERQRHRLLFTVEKDYRDDTEIDLSCSTVGRRPAR
jgi:hypothetical protein